MGIRSTVGSMLESTIGRQRTNRIRQAERNAYRASLIGYQPANGPPGKVSCLKVNAAVPARNAGLILQHM